MKALLPSQLVSCLGSMPGISDRAPLKERDAYSLQQVLLINFQLLHLSLAYRNEPLEQIDAPLLHPNKCAAPPCFLLSDLDKQLFVGRKCLMQ